MGFTRLFKNRFKFATSSLLIALLSFSWSIKAHAEASRILNIASSQRYSSLDPQLGYDFLSYQTLNSICANLTIASDAPAGYEFDLAQSMEFSDDGRITTFHLLPEQVFHNGKTLTSTDVVYSFNRLLAPEYKSPGASLFSNISGYEDYRAGKTPSIKGVRAVDKYTVQFELEQPQASFSLVLATNFGCIIPEGHAPVGFEFPISAGPFKVLDYTENNELQLEHFPAAEHRYGVIFDRINIESNMKSSEILAKYANKEIDFILDGLQWETISSVQHNPPVHLSVASHGTTYITLNTTLPPFDKLEVRQAVNFAINRKNLEDILKGTVETTTQIVPPGMTEFVENKRKYSYDPEKAKTLLETSTRLPITANIYAVNEKLYRELVFSIVSDLARVGIDVVPHFRTHQEILDVASSKEGGQMIFSDGLGWFADYYDASNFFFPLFTENAASDGGWNWSRYINKPLEEKAWLAEAIIEPQRRLERRDLWREIFEEIETDAPWVPLYNRRSNNVISASALDFVQENKPKTSANIHYIFKRK